MSRWHRSPEVLQAAARWKEKCLLDEGSVFSERRLWTLENLDHLDRYFVQNLDFGDGDFLQKLEAQLAPAPSAAKQLAAELLWVLFLFVSSGGMKPGTKRIQIRRVWEWSGEPLPPAEQELEAALEHGVGNPGTGYSMYRWRELVFLINTMRQWKRLPAEQRKTLAAEPWSFAEWFDAVPEASRRQLRHILLYLLFPDHFERIATSRDKQLVIRKFRKEFGEELADARYPNSVAVDREVLRVREKLSRERPDEPLDFYNAPIASRWKPKDSVDGAAELADSAQLDSWYRKTFGTARVWVVSSGEGGRMWPEYLREGIIAIDAGLLGDLLEYESLDAIRTAMTELHKQRSDPVNESLACWQFAREMQRGDYIIAKRGTAEVVGEGVIASDYEYDPGRTEYEHTRRIKWEATGSWSLEKGQEVQQTVSDFSARRNWLRSVWTLMHARQRVTNTRPQDQPVNVPYTVADALDGLFLSAESFSHILDALGRKKNVVLEGPPGVGKTFMARRLGYALMGQKESARLEMVQFHQSYAYEDFIQGWRPDGRGGFLLQSGVFHRFCERARQDVQRPYVFIIDEINRGNLSKVFGELLMLIEADKRGPDHAILLTYSQADGDRFSIPENVHIIGLMNTADRSLAMVDYALRRRFSFLKLRPAFDTAQFSDQLLGAGVVESLVARIVERFTALNTTIREDRSNLGPGFEIGHSFFVPPSGAERLDEAWYSSVIHSEIEPLLSEYWFDQPERVREQVDRLLK